MPSNISSVLTLCSMIILVWFGIKLYLPTSYGLRLTISMEKPSKVIGSN